MKGLLILIFLISLIYQPHGFAQDFAPKDHYLVDSLPYSDLEESDQLLLDSVLEIFHKSEADDQFALINVIVETTWDNRIWPKYNKWLLDKLESIKKSTELDSTNKVIYAGCLINHGYYLRVIGKVENALSYYQKSYEVYEELDNKEGLAFCLNNIGVIYDNLGDIPKALDCYHRSLKFQEEVGAKEGEANSLSNIGEVHRVLGDLDKALDYFDQSLAIQKEIGNQRGEAMTLVKLGDIAVAKHEYDKAQKYFEQAIELNKKIEEGYGIASAQKELSKLLYLKNKNEEALSTIKSSYVLFKQFGDKEELAKVYNILADIYFSLDSLTQAEKYSIMSIKASEELGFISLISSTSLTLSNIYERKGDFTKAHKYLKSHILLKDSTLNETNKKLSIRMQLQHDYDKQKAIDDKERENQVALANAEKARQQIVTIAFGAIGFLTVIFAIILFKRLKITKQQKEIISETNEELNQINEEILAQRDEIENQKNLVDEKNREITSSINYARRIQEAILPPEDLMKKYLPQSFVFYAPKDVVAGDFYWLEAVDNTVFFAAADCTGHGVPGAMVSVVCHGALNRSIREYNLRKPSEILDKTRELVIDTFKKSQQQVMDGMDICLCAWNENKRTLEYAGANNPLYVLKEKTMEIVQADRLPIGYSINQNKFTNHKIDLTDVEAIYLFTDGYADQFGGDAGKKLGYRKFRDKLIEIAELEMDVQQESLYSYFNQWRGNEEQLDDVCVIGVRF